MSFGDFVERNSVGARLATDLAYNMPVVAIPQPQLVAPSVLARSTKTILNSPGLSLTLTSSGGLMDGQALGGGGIVATGPGGIVVGGGDFGKSKDDDFESRSAGSDNVGGSGDEQEGDNPLKRKRYHRHTPQQIQELESLFKECPHPDEKQRLELSKRLNLEGRQVKFWFQNRRTQMKTQLERHENSILRQENDKLRAENLSLRGAMRSPLCTNCGGPAMLGEVSLEEQHLRIENARLKEELGRVCAIAGKFFSGPISTLPPISTSSLELAAGSNGFGGFIGGVSPAVPALSSSIEFRGGVPQGFAPAPQPVNVMGLERSLFAELALVAMDELVKMANTDRPLWSLSQEAGGKETLNYEEYLRAFPRCIGEKPAGFVTEATRESGLVIINSAALVETLMDPNRWMEMFPCMIARSSTTDVVSTGVGGTRNGALQLMHAELQVLSPFVPVREVRFLRFCKQHAEGLWAVVDVSINSIRESETAAGNMVCRVLPSGCVVQDTPNGYSKVVWVQHVEYDESGVHQLYRSLLSTGMGFGAQRWIATLQRQCECLAILMSSSTVSGRDQAEAIMPSGRRSMLKLAQRMVNNFCAGVCPSTLHQWDKLRAGSVDEDIRIMTRKTVNDPGEPPCVVLSAATSVWLPVSPQKLFDFLRDDRLRSEWDVLSNGGPMQEMAHIAKGQDHGNCVSLLRASAAMNANHSSMLILQETWTDSSGSLVVYAPVDIPAMHLVMSGGDSAYVALLPSGFAILPEGPPRCRPPPAPVDRVSPAGTARVAGSLLTVAFQILVNSLPTAKLTVESIDTVNNLISCTVQKIKAALHCDN